MIELVNLHADAKTAACLEHDAKTIGCEVAALQAVIAIEAGGHGFDKTGRLAALFEPHIFYKLLATHKPEALSQAVARQLAYETWGEEPYPADSYPRIEAARQISEEYAYQATSWGLPQILGMNFKAAGYNSAVEMVSSFLRNENEHIDAMCRFMLAHNLGLPLAEKDWAAFARGYNGAGFAKNGYAAKLAAAYESAYITARLTPPPSSQTGPMTPKAAAKGAVILAGGASIGLLQWTHGVTFWEAAAAVLLTMIVIAGVVFWFPKIVRGRKVQAQDDKAPPIGKPGVPAQPVPVPGPAPPLPILYPPSVPHPTQPQPSPPADSMPGLVEGLAAKRRALDQANADYEAHKALIATTIASLGQALQSGQDSNTAQNSQAGAAAPPTQVLTNVNVEAQTLVFQKPIPPPAA